MSMVNSIDRIMAGDRHDPDARHELRELRACRDAAIVKRAQLRQMNRRGLYAGTEYARELERIQEQLTDLSQRIDALVVIKHMRELGL